MGSGSAAVISTAVPHDFRKMLERFPRPVHGEGEERSPGPGTMTGNDPSAVVRDVRTLFSVGAVGGLTDGQLLERFVTRRDGAAEAAFAALVQRHGPMVWGVCRRILNDPHAAADAFQATFLVLVRKAGTVRVDDSLGRWLYGVSRRVAVRAKITTARRSAREGLGDRDGGGSGLRPGPIRTARGAGRGDRPAAGEIPCGGGAVRPRGHDARGGGASTGLRGGDRREPPGAGTGTSAGPADPPWAACLRRVWWGQGSRSRRPRRRCRWRWWTPRPGGAADRGRRGRVGHGERVRIIERNAESHVLDQADEIRRCARLAGDRGTDRPRRMVPPRSPRPRPRRTREKPRSGARPNLRNRSSPRWSKPTPVRDRTRTMGRSPSSSSARWVGAR